VEKDTGKAILIVSIDNANRINAADTLDYFLVDIGDYEKAVAAMVEHYEIRGGVMDTINCVMSVLNSAGITYEHIIEGRRFFFSKDGFESEHSCGGNCE